MGFDQEQAAYILMIEQALRDALIEPEQDWPQEGIPRNLNTAMRYSLLAGGKRLRPTLLLAACHLLLDDVSAALPFAAAVEMIHTYSLIHDDLPAMDNDDLRRGKPSNHKAFGEATAILAGDALLSLAYELMGRSAHPRALKALSAIASAAGSSGMIAGQAADMWMEGREADQDMLRYIHSHKTADLITAPVVAGLILAGADDRQLEQGRMYGCHLGLAFQIVDDLLDELGDEAKMGKRLGKDHAVGKLTWPGLYGIEQAGKEAARLIDKAVKAAGFFGARGEFLIALAQNSLKRVI